MKPHLLSKEQVVSTIEELCARQRYDGLDFSSTTFRIDYSVGEAIRVYCYAYPSVATVFVSKEHWRDLERELGNACQYTEHGENGPMGLRLLTPSGYVDVIAKDNTVSQ